LASKGLLDRAKMMSEKLEAFSPKVEAFSRAVASTWNDAQESVWHHTTGQKIDMATKSTNYTGNHWRIVEVSHLLFCGFCGFCALCG